MNWLREISYHGIFTIMCILSIQAHAENCEILNGQWEVKEHKIDNCGSDFEVLKNRNISTQGESYHHDDKLIKSSSLWIWKSGPETGQCSINGNQLSIDTNYENIYTIQSKLTLSSDKMSYEGTFTTKDNCGQKGTISAKRLSSSPTPNAQEHSSGTASSESSNSSNSNHQTRPHKERVNLPEQTGCISMGESKKRDATADTHWYLLKNSCAYPVFVRWCAGNGCTNSEAAATIPGGGTHETWAKKDSDGRVHLNIMACQLTSGKDEVYTDWPHKECWANVEMQ